MKKSFLINVILWKELVKITPPLNSFLNIILISTVLSLVIYQTAYSQTDEESLMEKGIDAILDSQFEDAIAYFDKILEKDPQNTQALTNKGVALGNLGKSSEAISLFDKVLEIDPNNLDALNNKGAALVALEKYDEALLYFDRILAIDPENQSAKISKKIILNREFPSLMEKGIIAILDTQFEEAIAYFDKILEKDPQNIKALSNKGVALGKLERDSEAIYQFDQVLEIDQNNTDALNNIGAVLINLGSYNDALSYYDRVLAIDPVDKIAVYSKRKIMHSEIFGGLQQIGLVDTMAAYVHLSLHDSNGNLLNYIESDSIVISNLSLINDYLDDIKSGELVDDPSIHEATYSFTKKNVTRNEQDLEMVTVRHQGVYNGLKLTVSKTLLSPDNTWSIISDSDGFPIHSGDHFDFLWIILRPIS